MSDKPYHIDYYQKNKDVIKKRAHDYYYDNREECIEKQTAYVKKTKERHNAGIRKRYQERRLIVINHYSNGTRRCECCSESELRFLTIDHIYNNGNKHRKVVGNSKITAWLIKNKFPKGYRVLCFNCNSGRAYNNGKCPHEEDRELV